MEKRWANAVSLMEKADRFVLMTAQIRESGIFIGEENGKPVPEIGPVVAVAYDAWTDIEVLAMMMVNLMDAYPMVRAAIREMEIRRGGARLPEENEDDDPVF